MKHPIIIYNGKPEYRKRRRYNVMTAAVQKARQEIMAQEDAAVWAALDAAALAGNK